MPFTEDGSQRGVIYWLGTAGETSEFRNPSVLGRTILRYNNDMKLKYIVCILSLLCVIKNMLDVPCEPMIFVIFTSLLITNSWMHVVLLSIIRNSASSEIDGTLNVLTARAHDTGAFFETDEEKGSWIRVDLASDYLIKPTACTLSYFIEGSEHVPLNWEFQVILDNKFNEQCIDLI